MAGPFDNDVTRDAAIQRFEHSVEAVSKAAKAFPLQAEGVEVGSPKSAVRSSMKAGPLDGTQAEAALAMVDDRNLTVHTCNEGLATQLGQRLAGHAATMRQWLAAMSGRASQT